MFQLKQIVCCILLILFTAQTFSGIFLVADYYLHTEKYIENCVNKNKPEMHCNGHCQLNKQLAKDQHKADSNQRQDSKLVSPYIYPTCDEYAQVLQLNLIPEYKPYLVSFSSLHITAILRPPIV